MIVHSRFPFATPTRRRHLRRGFSLAECILSVGISASSLLAVVGMLSGTLGVAKNSKDETVAGVLIRQLAGEIRDLPSLPPSPKDKQPEPVILLMDEAMKILDHSNFPDTNVRNAYAGGSKQITASAFARVERTRIQGDTLMDRVIIRVETPASAPEGRRTIHEYAALSPK